MTWRPSPKVQLLALSVTLVAGGFGAGYVAASRLLEKKFQERLEEEIQDAKSYYQEMYSTPILEKDDLPEEELLEGVRTSTQTFDGMPPDLVGQALAAVSSYDPEALEIEDEEHARHTPVIINNIFTSATAPGDEVLGALMADRDPSKPYIITREEFYQNEPDHEQVQFTYWEGDDILVDDRDEFNPIENQELVAGDDNLLRFGYGSSDENVLYIRNETLDPPLDLHVTKSTGKYAVEVMAVDEDGPHLAHSRDRKFRLHDE